MQLFIVLMSIILVDTVTGQYQNSLDNSGYSNYPGPLVGYGVPLKFAKGQATGPPPPPHAPLEEEDEGFIRTVKHVWIHTAEDDESSGIPRIIKAPIEREKQVNIIFIKAPAPAPADQQIVDIPNDGGKKTLVYVLLKKADEAPDVGFKTPAPTQPSKPEVYFIRYKDGAKPTTPSEYGVPPTSAATSPPAPLPVRTRTPIAPKTARYGVPATPQAKYRAPAPSFPPGALVLRSGTSTSAIPPGYAK